jgi:hypothetical protein
MRIVFTSDYSGQRRGFKAHYGIAERYTTVAPTTAPNRTAACSKTLIAHKSTKEFRFPKHSSRYPNNANCTWIIVNYHHDSKLALRFVHFDVEDRYDFVSVYADGVLQQRLTGNATNGTNFLAKRFMRIVFTSDAIVNKTGFRALYRAVDHFATTVAPMTAPNRTSTCNKALIAQRSTREFRFPKHSPRYPNNANCEWLIINYYHGTELALRFVHFDVENGYDFVSVYADGHLQERLTGNGTNGTTFWARRYMRIVFTSDAIVNKTGFRALYRAVDHFATTVAPMTAPNRTSTCNKALIAQRSTREFRFPKHSPRYPNNANCEWLIINYYHGTELALRFVHFDVENGYDFVSVYADGHLQERLTGNGTNGTTYWARRYMRIVFTSDAIVNKTGFRALYRLMPERPPIPPTNVTNATEGYLDCNFENVGSCHWNNHSGNATWTINSGSTSSSETGPSGDYPTGHGKYMYFETSYPVKTGDQAVYESDPIKAHTPDKCLKFAYHMYGAEMGQLRLLVKAGDRDIQLFHNNKSENRWKEFEVTLPEAVVDYKLQFVGIKGSGYRSDMENICILKHQVTRNTQFTIVTLSKLILPQHV